MQTKLNILHSAVTLFILTLLIVTYSCTSLTSENKSFQGDKKAIVLADKMFDAIGGKEAWCALNSLYIKATHTEPQMSIPYQSEIWRGINRFELVIEQQNDSFHVKGVMDKLGGTVRYYDKRDTFRLLSDEQLKDWEFGHDHNIYVLLHQLGCNPKNYQVKIDENDRLSFQQDSVFVASFGLDAQYRPHLFYSPNPDGTIAGTRFTYWETDEGLTHSAGGHPLDSNFMYTTELWQPSNKTLKEMFGDSIFEID
jgi:hypothetical protein